jgi:RES domain-containing protein
MQAWRLTTKARTDTAFDGEGARLHGGRWNRPGTPAIYTAATISLAALEILASADADLLSVPLVVIPVEWGADMPISSLEDRDLPKDWRKYPHPDSTRDIGQAWLASAARPVLSVPSAIVPQERLYVLNPRHARFGELRIGLPQPFAFDPRLW